MCLRGPPPPVFMTPSRFRTPFLDDLIGHDRAESLRLAIGLNTPRNDFFGSTCVFNESYLESSLSSLWAFLVVLIVFIAGLKFRSGRRIAWLTLGGSVAVSLIDTGFRVYQRIGYRGGYGGVMMHNLPSQLVANIVIQFAIPFAAGLALSTLIAAVSRAFAALRSKYHGRSQ